MEIYTVYIHILFTVCREKGGPGVDRDAREIFDFVDSRYDLTIIKDLTL